MKLVKAKNRNTIEISNAEPADAGNYICKVSANKPVQVEHKIQIRGKLIIIILPRDYIDEFIEMEIAIDLHYS